MCANAGIQPGETDDYKVSDHIKILNRYLGKKKIDIVIANNGTIPKNILEKYATEEQKDQVILDEENLKNVKIITGNYVTVENNIIRHRVTKLSVDIYDYLLENGEQNVLH